MLPNVSNRQSTWCCEETETPRVRTIFPNPEQPIAATTPVEAADSPGSHTWPSLVAAILEALLPFHDAWQAARQVIREARDTLPSTA